MRRALLLLLALPSLAAAQQATWQARSLTPEAALKAA